MKIKSLKLMDYDFEGLSDILPVVYKENFDSLEKAKYRHILFDFIVIRLSLAALFIIFIRKIYIIEIKFYNRIGLVDSSSGFMDYSFLFLFFFWITMFFIGYFYFNNLRASLETWISFLINENYYFPSNLIKGIYNLSTQIKSGSYLYLYTNLEKILRLFVVRFIKLKYKNKSSSKETISQAGDLPRRIRDPSPLLSEEDRLIFDNVKNKIDQKYVRSLILNNRNILMIIAFIFPVFYIVIHAISPDLLHFWNEIVFQFNMFIFLLATINLLVFVETTTIYDKSNLIWFYFQLEKLYDEKLDESIYNYNNIKRVHYLLLHSFLMPIIDYQGKQYLKTK